ncbi:unnamed protein product [Heterobilharzia americana]|nr:unnamed protein product [Heterobilharzia americana]CAH8561741.1 unnamed protein product [Heterobilharzia americana]
MITSGVSLGCSPSQFPFNFIFDVLMNITLDISDFTGTHLLLGGYLVDSEYAENIFLPHEDDEKIQGLLDGLSRNLSMFSMRFAGTIQMLDDAPGLVCNHSQFGDRE